MVGSQKGFTLIELIVVILILGILAATALPRFMSAQVDARIAKAQGIYGAVRSAAALAKARCELDYGRALTDTNSCSGSSGARVTMDGTVVTMVNRYPTGDDTGIFSSTQLDLTNNADSVTRVAAAGGVPYQIQVNGAATLTGCRVTYVPATATVAPVINVDTGGC